MSKLSVPVACFFLDTFPGKCAWLIYRYLADAVVLKSIEISKNICNNRVKNSSMQLAYIGNSKLCYFGEFFRRKWKKKICLAFLPKHSIMPINGCGFSTVGV